MKKRIAKIFSAIVLVTIIAAAVLYGAGSESYGAAVKTYNIDNDKLPYTQDQIYRRLDGDGHRLLFYIFLHGSSFLPDSLEREAPSGLPG